MLACPVAREEGDVNATPDLKQTDGDTQTCPKSGVKSDMTPLQRYERNFKIEMAGLAGSVTLAAFSAACLRRDPIVSLEYQTPENVSCTHHFRCFPRLVGGRQGLRLQALQRAPGPHSLGAFDMFLP